MIATHRTVNRRGAPGAYGKSFLPAASFGAAGVPAASRPLNILVLLADDMGWAIWGARATPC